MMKWWQNICVSRSWYVIGVALVVVVGMGWYGSGLFGQLDSSGSSMYAQGSKAVEASKKIDETFGASPDTQIVLLERVDARMGNATDEVYQQEAKRIVGLFEAKGASVRTVGANSQQLGVVSNDKTAMYVPMTMDGTSAEVYRVFSDVASQVDQSKLKVRVGGAAASEEETTGAVSRDLARTELVTLPILVVLLLFFFRSGVATLVPIIMSVVTVIGAFAVARFAALFTPIDTYAVNVITILGVGLSIDYALLSVNRFREEIAKSSVKKAVATIISTSGRTIFFSATTVVACLLVLLAFPVEFLHSIAIGSASAVLVAMAFTVVVLPAVLSLLGTRIDRWRLPFVPAHRDSPFWTWAARIATTRPVVTLLVAVVVVAVALIPLGQFRTIGGMNYHWLGRDSSAEYVAATLDNSFAKMPQTLTVLQTLPAGMSEDERLATSCEVTTTLRNLTGVKQVGSATPVGPALSCDALRQMNAYHMMPAELAQLSGTYARSNALKYDIVLSDDANTQAAKDTTQRVRDVRPKVGEWYVAGFEAKAVDLEHAYTSAIPMAMLLVAVGMTVLLTLLLRSVVIPLQAIVINAISLGISMGIVVGVFQLGWFSNLTEWNTTEGLVLPAPVLVVAIAFGLAMDYSVFLYSRMREVYDHTHDPLKAVRQGVIKTGPIITAAALALFAVVVPFAFSSVMFMQIIGLGLSMAVLVDAFFVRLVMVPSLMALMGRTSWYAPKWIARWQIRHE